MSEVEVIEELVRIGLCVRCVGRYTCWLEMDFMNPSLKDYVEPQPQAVQEAGPTTAPQEVGPSTEPQEVGPSAEPQEVGPSAVSLEADPSAISLEVNPSGISLGSNPSGISLGSNPSGISLGSNPSAFFLEMTPSAIALEINPSAFSLTTDSSTESMELEPSTISLEMDPSTTSLEMYPSAVSLVTDSSGTSTEREPSAVYLAPAPSAASLTPEPSAVYLAPAPSAASLAPEPSALPLGSGPSGEPQAPGPSTSRTEPDPADVPQAKRSKPNPCVVCLDLLRDYMIEQFLVTPSSSGAPLLNEALKYDDPTFVPFISVPPCVLLREYAVEVYTARKFPEYFTNHMILPINKAWSRSIRDKVAMKTNKQYDEKSRLHLLFNTDYVDDRQETEPIFTVKPRLRRKGDIPSRNIVQEFLQSINSEVFERNFPVPPAVPTHSLFLGNVLCKHDGIYIGGRYCKLVRGIGQSPWVVDGELVCQHSVQDEIFRALMSTFDCDDMVFSASGREDCDVRTLGRGRPFYVRVVNPRRIMVPDAEFRSYEEDITRRGLVAIRHLQQVPKDLIRKIKEGEEDKQKTYGALCTVKKHENVEAYVNKINGLGPLTLRQKTPIRVMHRRTLDTRERAILSMRAKLCDPVEDAVKNEAGKKMFELELVTQAGTYVKEFVHGDLGRTVPCLSTILDDNVDILALDVLDIDLDFPPEINNESPDLGD